MSSQLQSEIMECCNEINEKCEVEFEDFCFEHLRSRDWYINILEILFPHLESRLGEVGEIEDEAEAIHAMIDVINELDQF